MFVPVMLYQSVSPHSPCISFASETANPPEKKCDDDKVLCIMYQIPGTLEDRFKREKSTAIVTANHHTSS
jgi:hypothetical protein